MSDVRFTQEQIQYLTKASPQSRKIFSRLPVADSQTATQTEPQFDATESIEGIIASMVQGIEKYRGDVEKQQAEALAKYQAEQAKMEGVAKLNTSFTQRLEAAQKAMSAVDFQLKNEELHSKSRGQEYSLTDADKQARYGAEFSKLWSEEQDAEFNTLQQQWGSESTQWVLPVSRLGADQAVPQTSIMTPLKVGQKVEKDTLLTRKSTVLGG
jgi:hypothetical protein